MQISANPGKMTSAMENDRFSNVNLEQERLYCTGCFGANKNSFYTSRFCSLHAYLCIMHR